MKLSDLVSQMLYASPKKKVVKIRDPLCPRCKERPRSISKTSGKVADYCTECKREISAKSKLPKQKEN